MTKSNGQNSIDWLSLRAIVVDDRQEILQSIAKVLSQLGPSVTQATSGQEAINLVQSCEFPFHFAIVDMMMPGLTGLETADELRKLKPSIPVIFCSGLPRKNFATELSKLSGVAFLQKPFTRDRLESTLIDVLTPEA